MQDFSRTYPKTHDILWAYMPPSHEQPSPSSPTISTPEVMANSAVPLPLPPIKRKKVWPFVSGLVVLVILSGVGFLYYQAQQWGEGDSQLKIYLGGGFFSGFPPTDVEGLPPYAQLVFTEKDIQSWDWNTQDIVLSPQGKTKMERLKNSNGYGIGTDKFFLYLNGKKIEQGLAVQSTVQLAGNDDQRNVPVLYVGLDSIHLRPFLIDTTGMSPASAYSDEQWTQSMLRNNDLKSFLTEKGLINAGSL